MTISNITLVSLNDNSIAPIYTTTPISPTAGLVSGTLTLNQQVKNTLFAGPDSGSNAQPSFRTISLLQNDLSDVLITAPTNGQLLSYNSISSKWNNSSVAESSYSTTISAGLAGWTLSSGNNYTAIITHNLGTYAINVQFYNTGIGGSYPMVMVDSIVQTSANSFTVTVDQSNSSSNSPPTFPILVVVLANGQAIAAGGSTPSSILVQNGGSPLSGSYTTLNFSSGLQSTDAGGGISTVINTGVLSFNTRTDTVTLLSGDVTTALGFIPVNKAGDTMSGAINMGGFGITNLATPILSNDAVTKAYVDAASSTLNIHQSCVTATTADLSTLGYGTITYTNGTADADSGLGVGATLSNFGGSYSALIIDGHVVGSSGPIQTFGISYGSDYTPGTYIAQPISGGTGTSATATVDVGSTGVATSFTIIAGGSGYSVGDTITVDQSLLGNSGGSGLEVLVETIGGGGSISTVSYMIGGSGYDSGGSTTYFNVPLIYVTSGTGTLAVANIVVTSGVVTSVGLVNRGVDYIAGDLLTASNANLGGTGSGFKILLGTVSGDRVLIKNEANQIYNGIYNTLNTGSGTTAWVLIRSKDADNSTAGQVKPGDFVFVSDGTVNSSTGWVQTSIGTEANQAIIIGTENIIFTQFSGAGTYSAGTGLSLTGTTFANTGVLSFQTSLSGLTPSTPTTGVVTLSGTLGISAGGTGLASAPSNGQILIGNGTNYTLNTLSAGSGINISNGSGTIQVANNGVTSFSAGTTGLTPSSPTTGSIVLNGTLSITNGGTGQTTASAAFNALSPMTTTGDITYESATNVAARLGIGSAGQVLTVVSGLPSWAVIPSNVSSIAGTANQISASAGFGAVTLSIPNTFITPLFAGGSQETISAAGSSQGTATAIGAQFTVVNSVASGTGVILPTPVIGQEHFITNNGLNLLKIYPQSSGSIDSLIVNDPVTVSIGGTMMLYAHTTTSWITGVDNIMGNAGITATHNNGIITVATAITSTGDLLVGDGTNSATRLGIGLAGRILTVNSGGTTPQWTSPAALTVGTATASSNTLVTTTTTNSNYPLVLSPTSTTGQQSLLMRTALTYNPGTDILSLVTGASIALGTLSYIDTNIFASFQRSANSYTQQVLQNTNNGSIASIDFIVSNDLGTATTFYGDFGMNSSGFTGSGSFNQPSYVYLTSTSSDLALGTTTANEIHFVINGGTTDAFGIGTSGQWKVAGSSGTQGQVLTSTGASTAPVWTTPQIVQGAFTPATDSTTIPYGSSTPTSSQGTSVWSAIITPTASTSTIKIELSSVFGFVTGNSVVIAALFRGTTCIGTRVYEATASGISTPAANGYSPFNFILIDSPATASAVTYSLRIGSGTGTWTFGQGSQTLGGSSAGNYILQEIL